MPEAPSSIDMTVHPTVTGFFDKESNTISYVVQDPGSNACAVIDAVMDIDYAAGRLSYESADKMIAFIKDNDLSLEWLIETHAHADHLSGAPYIQSKLGGKIGIGSGIVRIQEEFGKIFNEGTEFQRDGSQFDRLFEDGDTYQIGGLDVFTMHTPGHTPACMTHVMGDAAFVGDTLFMPDGGTARADFPGGDARELFRSIKRVLSLPAEMRLFMCHDYGPGGTGDSVGDQRRTGTRQQHSRPRRRHRRRICRGARGTRQDVGHAQADCAVDPGQYPCRPPSGRG